ncbi:DEAD/DEAH box helicase family protein [Pseudonocardia aurantiaca]|uniref:BPTD_3080 family restriction endonuclease n=1 Tax=Pseudonocardia aurantiaca TaxID=75290 RepID=A0ABW4FSN9_9PSEU
MSDRVIEDPILNRPYDEPSRHFEFDVDGITDMIAERRRPSSYFIPVPQSRKGGRQLELTELTADQIQLNLLVNRIREHVTVWRHAGYGNVSPTTRRLLEHWADPERDNRVLFCQREAAETAIYLAEVAPRTGDVWIRNELAGANAEYNDGLNRVALKMATGSGKTVVMAMLIAWQVLNKVATPQNKLYSKRFLVVTPGLTIRDRLRVLLPSDPENYYRLRDLVPADLLGGLGQAQIVITNYHAFLPRELATARGVSRLTKDVLNPGGGPSPFTETEGQIVTRVLRDLGGSQEIVVFNDEAHHCYRGKVDDEKLTRTERTEAKERNEEARVWLTGLQAIESSVGVKTVYDLSATPFFLRGSGYQEGTLFPWVVSDFALIDAIESGIVKIPRMPVDDNQVSRTVTYLDLWSEVRDELPKGGRRGQVALDPTQMPDTLETALRALYDSYQRRFDAWEEAGDGGGTPPVFIVVCSNTSVSKWVFDWIGGYKRDDIAIPGELPLFSNVAEDGRWLRRPRTILVDSAQLESGDGMSAEFKKIAVTEINAFHADYARRFPGRTLDDVSDTDLLREVMNTVGKPGKLGEPVRCVVSVSMLTEGWDANTVTHILGIRAFGTQLLCEQVVGRGLRRRSYAVDDNGYFTPEYADVIGVPFRFIPTVAQTRDVTLKPTRRVHAEQERAAAKITFPRLTGYRTELSESRLFADFSDDTRLVLSTADFPTETTIVGIVGDEDTLTLAELKATREQTVAFELAKLLVAEYLDVQGQRLPWLFPQALRLTRQWLAEQVDYHDDTFPGLLRIKQTARKAAEKIVRAITWVDGARVGTVLPVLRSFDAVGSTAEVDFFTTKTVFGTSPDRCHVNYVTLDGPGGNEWERAVAKTLDTMPGVAAYAKNDHLGFSVPYTHEGITRQYVPDFLVRLDEAEDSVARTLIVEVSGSQKSPGPTAEKAATTRTSWVPAVNAHGGFGLWGYCEIGTAEITQAKKVLTAAMAALRELDPPARRSRGAA